MTFLRWLGEVTVVTLGLFPVGDLTPAGDAADKEQQRLNDALSGLAASLAGGIQGLVWGVWRRGTLAAKRRGWAA